MTHEDDDRDGWKLLDRIITRLELAEEDGQLVIPSLIRDLIRDAHEALGQRRRRVSP